MKRVVSIFAFTLVIGALCGCAAADSPETSVKTESFALGRGKGWKGYNNFGDACAAWPIGMQARCVFNWVNAQIALNGTVPTCADVAPGNQTQCIIDWVIELQKGLFPGLVGCGGFPSFQQLTCVINFVIQIQGNPNTVVGNTCAAFPPGPAQQACVNLWVDAQKCLNSTLLGCACASQGPVNLQQCVNDWVMALQKALSPNGTFGCEILPAAVQQACINTWVLLQQAKQAYNALPFPCTRFGNRKYQRFCRNACIIGQQMREADGDASKTCGRIDPSKSDEVQACITADARPAGSYSGCK